MHRRPWLKLPAGLLLTLFVVSGAAAPSGTSEDADTAELALARSAMREVVLSGFTRARAEVPLVAETSGRVLEVGWDIGERVTGERPFARIDDTFIRLDLDRVRVEQDRLTTQVAFDRREVERHEQLARRHNASASQLDSLEQALRNDTHALETAEVERKVLEERLARTRLKAPDGWWITARSVEPGQWIREGETLGRAADFSTLLVPFALTPEQLASLESEADGLTLRLPDLGREVAARIHSRNPAFDPENRKSAVEIAIDEPIEPARGGLRAELRLRLPERSGAVSLPRAALERSYEEHWVTREDGERLPVVELGADGTDPERVRVSSPGIRPGDRFRLQPTD